MNSRERKRRVLRDYPFISLQIQDLKDQYTEVFATATKITTTYSDSSGGSHDNESRIEKRCIKLAEISAKLKKAEAKKKKIENALDELKPYYKFLLIQIDVNGKGLSRVAHMTKRDVSSLSKTHNKALDELKL